MTKKEWLQALLDGKTMTSDEANGKPICFNANGEFEYIDSSWGYNHVSPNNHETNLREYFEYPMWFEAISNNMYKKMIVKFYSLTNGEVVVKDKNDKNEYYIMNKLTENWMPHTDKSRWKQVPEPISEVEEMTIEEVCKLIGKNIKIVKG